MTTAVSRAISVVVVGAVFLGGYFYLSNSEEGGTVTEPVIELSGLESATEVLGEEEGVPPGSLRYANTEYKFSLLYPEGMQVKEVPEPGGAKTIIFEDIENGLGFQIFVVPYSRKEVGPDRFLADVPSGIKTNEKNVDLGGVLATSFYTNHVGFGETYEVWSIHGGYLYEINTLKPLDQFLNSVVATWKFI